jgi:hypothetical protein
MDTKMKILISLLLIFTTTFSFDKSLRKTIIPVGTGEHEVKLSLLDDDPEGNLYSLLGFFVDSAANLYFLEEGTGKIKVFSDSGTYLRTLQDYKCEFLFLYRNEFIGQRKNKEKKDELIFFSKENGIITYRKSLSLGAGKWDAYKIKNDMLLFSPHKLDRTTGIKKAFDIKKRRFLSQKFKEWDDTTEQQIYSRYGEFGAEAIGKLNDYHLFWFPPPPKDTTYEYSLRAAKVDSSNIKHFQVNFKWQDVGMVMPDLTGAMINNRYIYTIGYPKIRKGSPPEIWVTRIDLKILLPNLWLETKDEIK